MKLNVGSFFPVIGFMLACWSCNREQHYEPTPSMPPDLSDFVLEQVLARIWHYEVMLKEPPRSEAIIKGFRAFAFQMFMVEKGRPDVFHSSQIYRRDAVRKTIQTSSAFALLTDEGHIVDPLAIGHLYEDGIWNGPKQYEMTLKLTDMITREEDYEKLVREFEEWLTVPVAPAD